MTAGNRSHRAHPYQQEALSHNRDIGNGIQD